VIEKVLVDGTITDEVLFVGFLLVNSDILEGGDRVIQWTHSI